MAKCLSISGHRELVSERTAHRLSLASRMITYIDDFLFPLSTNGFLYMFLNSFSFQSGRGQYAVFSFSFILTGSLKNGLCWYDDFCSIAVTCKTKVPSTWSTKRAGSYWISMVILARGETPAEKEKTFFRLNTQGMLKISCMLS